MDKVRQVPNPGNVRSFGTGGGGKPRKKADSPGSGISTKGQLSL